MNYTKPNPKVAFIVIVLITAMFAFVLSFSDEDKVTGEFVKITGMQTAEVTYTWYYDTTARSDNSKGFWVPSVTTPPTTHTKTTTPGLIGKSAADVLGRRGGVTAANRLYTPDRIYDHFSRNYALITWGAREPITIRTASGMTFTETAPGLFRFRDTNRYYDSDGYQRTSDGKAYMLSDGKSTTNPARALRLRRDGQLPDFERVQTTTPPPPQVQGFYYWVPDRAGATATNGVWSATKPNGYTKSTIHNDPTLSDESKRGVAGLQNGVTIDDIEDNTNPNWGEATKTKPIIVDSKQYDTLAAYKQAAADAAAAAGGGGAAPTKSPQWIDEADMDNDGKHTGQELLDYFSGLVAEENKDLKPGTEGFKAKLEELAKRNGYSIEDLTKMKDDIVYTNKDKIKQLRNNRRKEISQSIKEFIAAFIFGAMHPTRGALAGEELIEEAIGVEITVFDWKKGNEFWGYTMEGYATAICDKLRSEYFIQDSPGHLAAGSAPLGLIIWVRGKRIGYEKASWETSCSFNPKWFPHQESPDAEITSLGYLYKISWYVSHPYTEEQAMMMTSTVKSMNGLDSEGNIVYRVYMSGTGCSNPVLPSSYDMPSPDYYKLAPGGTDSVTLSYYDLAYMDEICIKFEDWLYNGREKKLCSNIKEELSNVQTGFAYFPDGTTAAGVPPGGFTPISDDSSTTGTSTRDCPPALSDIC